MLVIAVLIALMLSIGFFARAYNGRVRLLLLLGISAVVLYATVKL